MRWALTFLLLLLLTLLTGCFQRDMCFMTCEASDAPAAPVAPVSEFIGSWISEDPKPEQVTRIEVYGEIWATETTANTRIWAMCGSEECTFEGTGYGEWRGDTKGLNIYGDGGTPGSDRQVGVWLVLISEARARASVALYDDTSHPEPKTYYFTKVHEVHVSTP